MNYSQLNLFESLAKGLSDAGYITCTPVQEQVLNVSLDGSDLYVQSQTGTGKTAAYLVSIMQELLSNEANKGKKALIMVPTRELAVQVQDEARKIGKHTGLKIASFYGGVGYDKQVETLKKGVDIIIGTPGRVIDLNENGSMDLSQVAFLAVDEADRMFDMGFYPDLRKLIKVLPSGDNRQTMLFSATLNSYVKNLAWEYTKDAKEITIEAENITVDEIDQELIHVSSDSKLRLLTGILGREKPQSCIIFCNTKRMCEVLAKRLQLNGIETEFIIGDLPQSKRLKIMNEFKGGKVKCLVATDVAARGIDVNDLAMVVNYDLPNEAENYVHRIGRTARAGKSGKAYTFCSEQDVYSLVPIERYIEKQIPSRVALDEDYGEDKSAGVYIRTKEWMEDDGRRSKGKKRDDRRDSKKEGSSSRRKSEGKSQKRDSKKEKTSSKGSERKTVKRLSKEELDNLSSLSYEERMKYYREQYAGTASGKTKGNGKKSSRNDRRSPSKKESFRKESGKKAAGKTNTQNNKSTKKGLFAKIKSLFSKAK